MENNVIKISLALVIDLSLRSTEMDPVRTYEKRRRVMRNLRGKKQKIKEGSFFYFFKSRAAIGELQQPASE